MSVFVDTSVLLGYIKYIASFDKDFRDVCVKEKIVLIDSPEVFQEHQDGIEHV